MTQASTLCAGTYSDFGDEVACIFSYDRGGEDLRHVRRFPRSMACYESNLVCPLGNQHFHEANIFAFKHSAIIFLQGVRAR